AKIQSVIGRARWRQNGAIKVGGQQTSECGTQLKALLGSRAAGNHGRAIVGAYPGALKALPVKEHVEGDVVRVWPDRQLGIIVEVVAVGKGVTVERSGRIRRGRNRDALHIGRGRDRELGKDPAIGKL